MYKSIIIVAVTWLIPLQTIASEYPTAPELLDKYAETQNKLKSFILKAQTSRKGKSSTAARGKFSIDYSYEYELRFDGNRANVRRNIWGKLNARLNMTKDEALYRSNLWDGETFFRYHRSANNKILPLGSVTIAKIEEENNKRKTFKNCDRDFPGSSLRGYFPADTDRIDTILRKAKAISVRNEMENIGGSNCYVIEAKTKSGRYKVWIDPSHGYHIAKATGKREPGNVVFPSNYTLKQTEKMSFSMENVRFTKVDDVWVPMEVDLAYSRIYPGDNFFDNTKIHQKVIDIILNPDHDALGSFVPDDIPDGARAYAKGVSAINYTWQNGELIPNVDKYVIDEIDKMTAEIMAEGKVPPAPVIKDSVPDSLTVSELLDKYAATQNKLQSFIAKAESKIEYVRMGSSGRMEKQNCEFRLDGNRVYHRSFLLPGRTNYNSFLWDGKSFIQYRKFSQLTDGRVFIEKNHQSKKRLVSMQYKGAPLMGICPGDYDRIDSILRKADNISLQQKTEQVGSSQCYVIDAVTTRGKYKVWFDPQHGYNIAKIELQKRKGDLIRAGGRVKTGMSFLLKNVRFKKIDDIWVPMEADMEQTEDNGSKTTKWHHKRTQMTLNPDHDALDSFVPDDIPNGTKVNIAGSPGKYIWQNGQPIVEVGSDVKS